MLGLPLSASDSEQEGGTQSVIGNLRVRLEVLQRQLVRDCRDRRKILLSGGFRGVLYPLVVGERAGIGRACV